VSVSDIACIPFSKEGKFIHVLRNFKSDLRFFFACDASVCNDFQLFFQEDNMEIYNFEKIMEIYNFVLSRVGGRVIGW
jgi:hypothetical protein